MGVLGIGVDVVHLPRVSALVQRRGYLRLASRILSSVEREDIPRNDPVRQMRFLAVRWAVKEAAYKALYPTVKPTWKELSFHSLRAGQKPHIVYHPTNQNVGKLHVSVSHDGDYIFATVLAETP